MTASVEKFALKISLAAAFGGLLFGYDTAVISGVLEPVRKQFALNAVYEGWFVSSGLWGCILGVLIAGMLSNAIGRKRVLILSGLAFLVSAGGCTLASGKELLVISRLVGGIGVGIASVISPMYISEFAPAAKRGMLVALYQLAIAVGIFLAYLVNALIATYASRFGNGDEGLQRVFGSENWRGMFLMMSIPSLVFILVLFLIPESIRYLIKTGRTGQAKSILFRTRAADIAENEWRTLSGQDLADTGAKKVNWQKLRMPLFIGLFLAFFQQFSGINAIIYYGPEIFKRAGITSDNALLFQSVIGAVNILFTFVAIRYADRAGRRTLLLYGLAGLIVSLFAIGLSFNVAGFPGYLLLFLMLVYIACFALSLGPVTWILINEIFPSAYRVQGVTICTLGVWLAVALLGQFFPVMLENFGSSNTFWIFSACCLLNFIVSFKLVPETKGTKLEEVEKLFIAH